MEGHPAVYILANKRNGTLYIGVTNNLVRRVCQHRNDVVDGFSQRHGLHLLVWYELGSSMYSAIQREKQLKNWRRQWKLELIEAENPYWRDLWSEICT